ncbi:MAG TPA: c-type cytochrome [Nitrospirota bacterium]|nr:c-type cytochrome [Nitrospirota bacterium]
MKKVFVVLALGVAVFLVTVASIGMAADPAQSGEALFKQHCAVCHPDGGNIVNPKKTLHKQDREANNVKTEADIVKIMRNPGPGMIKFDANTIPDKQAKEIAAYILKSLQ